MKASRYQVDVLQWLDEEDERYVVAVHTMPGTSVSLYPADDPEPFPAGITVEQFRALVGLEWIALTESPDEEPDPDRLYYAITMRGVTATCRGDDGY